MEERLLALILGFLLDLLLGDPRWLPHPVRGMGWLITRGESILRPKCCEDPARLRWGGMVLAVVVLLLCTAVPVGILLLAGWISPWLRLALHTLMCYQILAARSLRDESLLVYQALARGDLEAARHAVSRIVGRDTHSLSAEGVAKAAVETVAESTCDGVIAPLFYLALGGAPLGFCYKATNTMDSMLGYKNDRYLHFGRFAARLDDVANLVPARLAALLLVAVAAPLGLDARGSWRIFHRDRLNHASPNSAHTESAVAGALGVQLAGPAYYFGKLHQKPTIGEPLRPVGPTDILRTNQMMLAAAALMVLFCAVVLWVMSTLG